MWASQPPKTPLRALSSVPKDDLKYTPDTSWRAFGLLADKDQARPEAAHMVCINKDNIAAQPQPPTKLWTTTQMDKLMVRVKDEYGLTDAELGLTASGTAADQHG